MACSLTITSATPHHAGQVMLAIVSLANAGIMHGDIKASNVMVTAFDQAGEPVVDPFDMAAVHYFTPKLVDFGSGQQCYEVRHHG